MVSLLVVGISLIFCFKQKTAYEMRISDWSSDVCSSDLLDHRDIRNDQHGCRLWSRADAGGLPEYRSVRRQGTSGPVACHRFRCGPRVCERHTPLGGADVRRKLTTAH